MACNRACGFESHPGHRVVRRDTERCGHSGQARPSGRTRRDGRTDRVAVRCAAQGGRVADASPRSGESGTAEEARRFHGGRLIARRLKAHGVSKLFTLSGGHLFSIYDGCREEGIEIVDVRHESTAAFAAEGWAKVTREAGRVRADGRAGRDERDERDGLRAGEPFADGGARAAGHRRCAGVRGRCRRSTTCRSCGR